MGGPLSKGGTPPAWRYRGRSEVDGAVFQRLLLRIQSAKRGQQAGVNVQNPAAIRVNEFRRQDPHVSGKANEIYLTRLQRANDIAIMLFATSTSTFNHECLNSACVCFLESRSVGFVGSPTILIDGADVAPPSQEEPVGLSCRVYRRRDGRISPTPDPDDLREALRRAAERVEVS